MSFLAYQAADKTLTLSVASYWIAQLGDAWKGLAKTAECVARQVHNCGGVSNIGYDRLTGLTGLPNQLPGNFSAFQGVGGGMVQLPQGLQQNLGDFVGMLSGGGGAMPEGVTAVGASMAALMAGSVFRGMARRSLWG